MIKKLTFIVVIIQLTIMNAYSQTAPFDFSGMDKSVKPGDASLSCGQLQNEYADAERYRTTAEKEKTVTGENVARAIFFWPAILGTAANANEAIAAANCFSANSFSKNKR